MSEARKEDTSEQAHTNRTKITVALRGEKRPKLTKRTVSQQIMMSSGSGSSFCASSIRSQRDCDMSPATCWACVSNGCLTTELDNSVTVIDPQALKVVGTIPTGQPAYVSCDASGQVAALDLKTWKVEKLIDTGPGADGLAWARTE